MDMLIPILAPIVSGLIVLIVRNFMGRLEKLESRTLEYAEKDDVKAQINEKLEPLKEGLVEIKEKLDKLFDIYINDRRS